MTILPVLFFSATLAQAAPPPQKPTPPPAPPQAAGTVPKTPAGQPQTAAGQKLVQSLAIQVALDRAGFSPGAIDGSIGSGTKKALAAYRKVNGGEPPAGEAVTGYEITQADIAGPYEPSIPAELPDQGKLPALSYKDVVEALAERFHTTPALLKKLNPTAKFAAGEQIAVPNVEPLQMPADGKTQAEPAPKEKPAAKPQAQKPGATQKPAATPEATGTTGASSAKPDAVITVSKSESALTLTDASGKVLMYAPVTIGSGRDPLPLGEWKVNGITMNPPFRYNPDLFWDADPSHTKTLIKPGPNNPVGLVWIDLSKEHYGIHGTPEPSTVGKTNSHGCVRLTNWDAVKLAGLVKPGTKVVFKP